MTLCSVGGLGSSKVYLGNGFWKRTNTKKFDDFSVSVKTIFATSVTTRYRRLISYCLSPSFSRQTVFVFYFPVVRCFLYSVCYGAISGIWYIGAQAHDDPYNPYVRFSNGMIRGVSQGHSPGTVYPLHRVRITERQDATPHHTTFEYNTVAFTDVVSTRDTCMAHDYSNIYI